MAGLNLTKIESRPIEDSDFSYYFYVDVLGNVNDEVTLDLFAHFQTNCLSLNF